MSQLEELIQELCPDGVEYKTLEEIATISRGGNLQKKDFRSEGVSLYLLRTNLHQIWSVC